MVNAAYSKEVQENRNKSLRIIKALENDGRIVAPLQVHRNSGVLNLTDEIDYSQG